MSLQIIIEEFRKLRSTFLEKNLLRQFINTVLVEWWLRSGKGDIKFDTHREMVDHIASHPVLVSNLDHHLQQISKGTFNYIEFIQHFELIEKKKRSYKITQDELEPMFLLLIQFLNLPREFKRVLLDDPVIRSNEISAHVILTELRNLKVKLLDATSDEEECMVRRDLKEVVNLYLNMIYTESCI